MKYRPLVKCHGGKRYLRDFIISHFPPAYEKMTYVEPFIGGGSVFLNKLPSTDEVINDLDFNTYNLWWTIQNSIYRFMSAVRPLVYEENTFKHFKSTTFTSNGMLAVQEYVLRRMSRGGLKKSFAKSNRLRGGKMGDENAWLTSLDQLQNIHKRILNTPIFNVDANYVIMKFDSPNTLHYLDPPYLHSTRKSCHTYSCEMDDTQHEDLLKTIIQCRGKVIISGYNSPLYKWILEDTHMWNKYEKEIVNHSSQKKSLKSKQKEIIWANF